LGRWGWGILRSMGASSRVIRVPTGSPGSLCVSTPSHCRGLRCRGCATSPLALSRVLYCAGTVCGSVCRAGATMCNVHRAAFVWLPGQSPRAAALHLHLLRSLCWVPQAISQRCSGGPGAGGQSQPERTRGPAAAQPRGHECGHHVHHPHRQYQAGVCLCVFA
jgi:hypothetical protein